MLAFFLFVMIILGFIGGSALIYVLATHYIRGLDRPPPPPMDALLREEVESLALRLERVEEELEFYKELNAPDRGDPAKGLPAPEEREP